MPPRHSRAEGKREDVFLQTKLRSEVRGQLAHRGAWPARVKMGTLPTMLPASCPLPLMLFLGSGCLPVLLAGRGDPLGLRSLQAGVQGLPGCPLAQPRHQLPLPGDAGPVVPGSAGWGATCGGLAPVS